MQAACKTFQTHDGRALIVRNYRQRNEAARAAFRAQRGQITWLDAAQQLQDLDVPFHRALTMLKGAMRRQRLDRALKAKLTGGQHA